jgi:hypothetical protein
MRPLSATSNFRQPPHCDQATAALLPANQRGCATSANSYFYRRTQRHDNGKTDQPNGRKSLSIAEK